VRKLKSSSLFLESRRKSGNFDGNFVGALTFFLVPFPPFLSLVDSFRLLGLYTVHPCTQYIPNNINSVATLKCMLCPWQDSVITVLIKCFYLFSGKRMDDCRAIQQFHIVICWRFKVSCFFNKRKQVILFRWYAKFSSFRKGRRPRLIFMGEEIS